MKIRVNDLARELHTKSKAILDVLPELGITRVVTHSGALEPEEVTKVRAHFATPQPRMTGNATLGLAKSIAARFGEEI
jgi:hypothetical protein